MRKQWAAGLVLAVLVGAALSVGGADPPTGVVIRQDGAAERQTELAKRITSAPAKAMAGGGLAGVAGVVRVRVTADQPQEVLLPIPQLVGGQVPVCFLINNTPADAVIEFRLRKTEGGDTTVVARLAGKKQEVQIAWSAVVLLTARDVTPDRTPAEPYRAATACVQADADEVKKLAAELWPKSGKPAEFAAAVRKHIGAMKRAGPPRSLDALGILKSGENGICTANANLAAALMRAKGVACRSVVVVPPIGQRLEMHRIAEYHDGGRWVPFDPSGLTADIPAKPWQNVVMARTAVRDEQAAMKPRMGAMPGCPYGQEAELLTPGVTLFGQDFFWTQAAPLAEFEPTAEAERLAAAAWSRYLETGTLTAGQLDAASAKTAAELAGRLKGK
jgi:hypothetical protein